MSKNEASETIASAEPRTQRTGGLGLISTIADVSKYCGAMVFSTPSRPAANPGQFSLATLSPG